MAIYTKSGGEIKSVTPYLKRNGEVITPSSVWVKHGGEVHKVWPVEEKETFEIYDQATLEEFRDRVNAGEYDLDAVVTADFTLTGDFGDPIGTNFASAYTGNFYGQGYTITGLTINSKATQVGLFGYLNGATIRDVNLAETNITATANSGYVGGIAGITSGGRISGCTNSGNVSASISKCYVGGIVGNVGSPVGPEDGIVECAMYGTVTNSRSTGYAGGIAGVSRGRISLCNNYSTVTAVISAGVAGGITVMNYAQISECTNAGEINGYRRAGGISGINNTSARILRCTNTGDVTAKSSGTAGGITAFNNGGTVTDCVNTGAVDGGTVVIVDGESDGSEESEA